jgi:hypothetical protein
MRSKEEHYGLVRQLRAIVQDPENLKCTCPKTKCEWHGKCLECVALHRYHKDHMPNCLQQVFKEVSLITWPAVYHPDLFYHRGDDTVF